LGIATPGIHLESQEEDNSGKSRSLSFQVRGCQEKGLKERKVGSHPRILVAFRKRNLGGKREHVLRSTDNLNPGKDIGRGEMM